MYKLSAQKGIANPLIIVAVVVAAIVVIGIASGAFKFSGYVKVDDKVNTQDNKQEDPGGSIHEPTPSPKVQSKATLNDEPYSSSEMKFSIRYPKGWVIKPQSSSVNIFLPKAAGSTQADALITISSVPAGQYKDTKLSTIGDLQKVNIKNQFEGVNIIGDKETKVAGLNAYEIEFTGSLNSQAIHAKYYIVSSGSDLYSLITFSADDLWVKNQDNFQSSLDTFKPQ